MFNKKLRGLYFIVGENQFLSHAFDNILSKSLDLGLNLLQYILMGGNFIEDAWLKMLNKEWHYIEIMTIFSGY